MQSKRSNNPRRQGWQPRPAGYQQRAKRHITSARWDGVRLAFERAVQHRRSGQSDPKLVPFQTASLEVLIELLSPLTARDTQMIRDRIAEAALGDSFASSADMLIFDLGISL